MLLLLVKQLELAGLVLRFNGGKLEAMNEMTTIVESKLILSVLVKRELMGNN